MKNISLLFLLPLLIFGCNEKKQEYPCKSSERDIRNKLILQEAIIEHDTIDDELFETQFYTNYDSLCFNRIRINNNSNLRKISTSIPANQKIIYFKESDINSDGIIDLIVVTKREKKQVGISYELQNSSLLFLFIGKKDGSFQLASFNAWIVIPSLNDYDRVFTGVECFKGGFTILHYHGTNNWWGNSATFVFNKDQNDWYLIELFVANAYTKNPCLSIFSRRTFKKQIIPFDIFQYSMLNSRH